LEIKEDNATKCLIFLDQLPKKIKLEEDNAIKCVIFLDQLPEKYLS